MTAWALEGLVEQIESRVRFLWPPYFLVPSSLENKTTLPKSGSAHQVSSASMSALSSRFAIVPGSEPAKGRGEGRRLRLYQTKVPSGE